MGNSRQPPLQLLEFIELEPFVRRWERFGFPDEELGNLQIEIMGAPKLHPVIQGTRGLRKMRYAPVSWARGKSGALRVCYVFLERLSAVLLVVVYAKNEMDDLPEKMKPVFNAAIDEIETKLQNRLIRRRQDGKVEEE